MHGHVVYLSVCINGLFSLKPNIGYWITRREKDNQIKQLTFSFIQMCIITLSYKPKNVQRIFNIISNTYFKANDTLTDDTDGFVTVISKREEEPLRISGVMYLIIGLVATSVLFIMLYLCTHVLENANCKIKPLFWHTYMTEVSGSIPSGIISGIVCYAQILYWFIYHASSLKNKTYAL